MEWVVRLCVVVLIVFRVQIVGCTPQNVSKTIVENLVKDAIEVVSHSIAVAGFDPYHLNHSGFSAYPIPKFLKVNAFTKNVIFNGASHIVINNVTFIHSKLTLFLDLSLPLLYFSANEACMDVKIVDKHYNVSGGGSLLLNEVRTQFAVVLKVQKTGLVMHNITMDFAIGDIVADINAQIFGKDVSAEVNDIINNQIPLFIKSKQKMINEALGSLVGTLLKEILNT